MKLSPVIALAVIAAAIAGCDPGEEAPPDPATPPPADETLEHT